MNTTYLSVSRDSGALVALDWYNPSEGRVYYYRNGVFTEHVIALPSTDPTYSFRQVHAEDTGGAVPKLYLLYRSDPHTGTQVWQSDTVSYSNGFTMTHYTTPERLGGPDKGFGQTFAQKGRYLVMGGYWTLPVVVLDLGTVQPEEGTVLVVYSFNTPADYNFGLPELNSTIKYVASDASAPPFDNVATDIIQLPSIALKRGWDDKILVLITSPVTTPTIP
jgi:hypothetical protein